VGGALVTATSGNPDMSAGVEVGGALVTATSGNPDMSAGVEVGGEIATTTGSPSLDTGWQPFSTFTNNSSIGSSDWGLGGYAGDPYFIWMAPGSSHYLWAQGWGGPPLSSSNTVVGIQLRIKRCRRNFGGPPQPVVTDNAVRLYTTSFSTTDLSDAVAWDEVMDYHVYGDGTTTLGLSVTYANFINSGSAIGMGLSVAVTSPFTGYPAVDDMQIKVYYT
jgi:hypothetical protein